MFTLQHVTTYDPTTDKVTQRDGLRRADTLPAIEAMAGKAEADEFREAVVVADPDRRAPYVSKSGRVVVVFTPKADPRDSWERPSGADGTTTRTQRRVRCDECGKVSNGGGIGIHQRSTGHKGTTPVEA